MPKPLLELHDAIRLFKNKIHVGQYHHIRELAEKYMIPKEIFTDSEVLFEAKLAIKQMEFAISQGDESKEEELNFLKSTFPSYNF